MTEDTERRCTRCVLPASFPAIEFNDQGLCTYCWDAPSAEEYRQIRIGLRKNFEATLEAVRGKGEYECVVAYSGGKDSTYVLWLLVEHYGLKCLAVTIDNGFLADKAVVNCRVVTDQLGVDHMMYKPSFHFMKGMYSKSLQGDVHVKASITRASAVCNSCINLINNHMIKVAVHHDVTLVAGGYLGGQVPKDAAVLELNLDAIGRARSRTMEAYVKSFGPDSNRFFALPAASAKIKKMTVVNPLLTLDYNEGEVLETIRRLGWEMPPNTGRNSSNCRLNDLGIVAHQKRYGFNPYVFEYAELVRQGLMDRAAALKKMAEPPTLEQVEPLLDTLGMSAADV